MGVVVQLPTEVGTRAGARFGVLPSRRLVFRPLGLCLCVLRCGTVAQVARGRGGT